MAINRADYLAQTFTLPQYQQPQPIGPGSGRGAGGPDSPDFGIGDPASGLQYTGKIGEISKKYYQDYAELNNFAKTMWKNYKIDVTTPDPTRPESVQAAETFKQGLANLLYTADQLKESETQFKSAQTQNIAGNYEFSPQAFNQPFAANTPQQSGYSTELPAIFDVAKSNINRQVDTGGEFNRLMGEQSQFSQPYDQAAAAAPNDPRAQYLSQAAEQLSPVYNMPTDTGQGAGTGAILNLANELSRIATGTHFAFKPIEKFSKSGSMIREASPPGWVGSTLGNDPRTGKPFVVAKFEQDPDTGEVTAVSNTGARMGLDPQNIDVTFRSFIDSNRGAFSRTDYDKFVKQIGLDNAGRLSAYNFVSPQELSERDAAIQEGTKQAPQVQAVRDDLRQSLQSLSSGGMGTWLNNVLSPTGLTSFKPHIIEAETTDGRVLEIVKDGTGTYKIDNYVEIFGRPDKTGKVDLNGQKVAAKGTFTNVPLDRIMSILEQYGYVNLKLKDKEGKEVPVGQDQSAEQIQAEELIRKYGGK